MKTEFYSLSTRGDYEYGCYTVPTMYIEKELQYNQENAIKEISDTIAYIQVDCKSKVAIRNILFAIGSIDKEHLERLHDDIYRLVEFGISCDDFEIINLSMRIVDHYLNAELVKLISDKEFTDVGLVRHKEALLRRNK